MREYYRSIADFNQAIALGPRENVYYYNCGMVYSSMSKYDQAMADVAEALWLAPNEPNGYNTHGYILHRPGNLKGAIANYTRAIELDPQFGWAYSNRRCQLDVGFKQNERDWRCRPWGSSDTLSRRKISRAASDCLLSQ